jgi:acyl carrier protein
MSPSDLATTAPDVLRAVQSVLAAVLTPGGSAADTFPPASSILDFGVSSIQMVQIHAQLESALGRQIPKSALFDHPTVGGLVTYLTGTR